MRNWLISSFLLLHICALMSQNNLLEVCEGCEFNTIKTALSEASAHDTLLIRKGTYKEYDLIIEKPLTILGEDNPVIDGMAEGEVMRIVSDSVHVEGISIINVGTSYTTDYAAIRVAESKYFTIKNLSMEQLFFGIYLEKAEHGTVIGNTIIGDAVEEFSSGNGIHLWYCKNVEVRDNYVEQVRDGIYLEFSDQIRILNNTSVNNLRYGLHFMFSNDDVYEGNLFENNGAGVAVMFSKAIKMHKNIFRNNWGGSFIWPLA